MRVLEQAGTDYVADSVLLGDGVPVTVVGPAAHWAGLLQAQARPPSRPQPLLLSAYGAYGPSKGHQSRERHDTLTAHHLGL